MPLLHDMLEHRAHVTPHATALTGPDGAWTYAELLERSRRTAAWLAGRGVSRGDRVLLCAPHARETVAAIFAASRLGALYVVAGDRLPARVLDHLVADCEPRVVVHDPRELRAGDAGAAPREDGNPCAETDPVSLLYTSGSTARPKAVVSTHAQVRFVAGAIQSQLRYRSDDVVFGCLPMSFDYGLYQAFLACLSGAALHLGSAADAGPGLVARLRASEATVLPAVPSLASNLALLLARGARPPARLRLLTNTGAHLAPSLASRLRALLPGLSVVSMYGLTECKRVSILTPDGDLRRPGSVGRPLPGTEAFVVDEDGRRLPAGEVGELVVRGPHVMSGYWRAPELTSERFRPDDRGRPQLFTGDYFRIDRDGHLYFLGRRDDVYKHRGFRLSGTEVEAAALEVPGVTGAALVPPDGGGGLRLVVTGDVSPDEVLDGLRERLEAHKLPDVCTVVDGLPLAATGKVDRRALAALV